MRFVRLVDGLRRWVWDSMTRPAWRLSGRLVADGLEDDVMIVRFGPCVAFSGPVRMTAGYDGTGPVRFALDGTVTEYAARITMQNRGMVVVVHERRQVLPGLMVAISWLRSLKVRVIAVPAGVLRHVRVMGWNVRIMCQHPDVCEGIARAMVGED